MQQCNFGVPLDTLYYGTLVGQMDKPNSYTSLKHNTSEKLIRARVYPSVVYADLLLSDYVRLAPSYNLRLTHVVDGKLRDN